MTFEFSNEGPRGTGLTDGDKTDITVSASGSVLTIDNNAVTYAKIQDVSATDRILGRESIGAGDIEEIICTAYGRGLLTLADAASLTALSNTFTAALKGLVPPPTTATGKVLSDNGTWISPGTNTTIFEDTASQLLTAGSTITVVDNEPYTPITSSGNITLTSEPAIAAGRNGQLVILKNVNSTGNITISDVNSVGGCLIRLTANTITINPGGTMGLIYDSTVGFWIQQWILNPQTFTPSISGLTCASHNATLEVANSGVETAPSFALTYVGTPSTCSIDISSGGDPSTNWPITVPSPYTSLNSGTSPPSATWNKQTTVNSTRVFTATATVAGIAGLTRTITFTYLNRRYCGPQASSTTLTSGEILGLDGDGGTSDLSNSRTGTFSSINIGIGEYLWYAYRSALGTGGLYLSIAGEAAGFTEQQTALSHTNDSGFVENFATWKSTNTNLGSGLSAVVSTVEANNRIYIGPSTDTNPISNANILALDDTADGESIVSSTLARTYTAIRIEVGEYLWFCHPSRITDLATIKDGTTGFSIAGSYRSNVIHTNQYGYTETYRCWRSDNPGIYPSGENIVVT